MSWSQLPTPADILQIGHWLGGAEPAGGNRSRDRQGADSVPVRRAAVESRRRTQGQMRSEIAGMHRRLSATMIYVTHDQVEATTTADTIVVLRDGVVEQSISPAGREIRWQANGRALRQFRTLRGKRQRYPWENLFIPPNACARPQAAFSILPLKIRDRQLVETGTLHSTVAEHARERCSRLSTSSGPGAEKAASGNRWVEPAEAPVLDLTACGREDVLTS